ncbi:leucine-rich repeat extensin-like protein 5 [Belonocnema kinseyi]|uniref:leucine-rich repeat extensin-like protein 5 n=1 Tax=Belonocnema kinseyi TaxID=2817044 RepID=UPI00143DCEB3|nr:leucine-rich repeat extensin-like protein 5 [Belonocnema kinseyi]
MPNDVVRRNRAGKATRDRRAREEADARREANFYDPKRPELLPRGAFSLLQILRGPRAAPLPVVSQCSTSTSAPPLPSPLSKVPQISLPEPAALFRPRTKTSVSRPVTPNLARDLVLPVTPPLNEPPPTPGKWCSPRSPKTNTPFDTNSPRVAANLPPPLGESSRRNPDTDDDLLLIPIGSSPETFSPSPSGPFHSPPAPSHPSYRNLRF